MASSLNCVGDGSIRGSRTDTSLAGRVTAIPHAFR
jgi:hypothetical protein